MSVSMFFANAVCFFLGLFGAVAIEDIWVSRKGRIAAWIWAAVWMTPPLIRLYIEAVFG